MPKGDSPRANCTYLATPAARNSERLFPSFEIQASRSGAPGSEEGRLFSLRHRSWTRMSQRRSWTNDDAQAQPAIQIHEDSAMIYSFSKASVAMSPGDAFWVYYPKNAPGRRGQYRSADSGGEVLPNVLPLPRKSSPKQDEPRAIRMSYVIEIQGTT